MFTPTPCRHMAPPLLLQAEVMPNTMPHREQSLALFTDLYELTMAQGYWQSGKTARATFSLFFRKYPPDRAYFVFAGLHGVLSYLEGFRFSYEDVAYLRSTAKFDGGFLDYLSQLRFTGTVRAMPEGAVFFSDEPVIEVTAPVVEAQIVETFVLNQVNLQSILATKASRVVYAAPGKTIVDFAARRAQGTDAASNLGRVSYMVGFAGTNNVLAGQLYGIPTFGTMAHSFVTSFEHETDSFRAYARSFPDSSTFLVDTYDTIEGTKNAIKVAHEMKKQGHSLRAIRLDSGDLLDLALKTRKLLDEAGLGEVEIFASGGLDEFEVDRLLVAGAPIDGFGVGTKAEVKWTTWASRLPELWRWKIVPSSAFRKADYQSMEGVMDVSRGDLRTSSPGLHGRRDERSGSLPGVWPAPGHGAQDAGLLGAPRIPTPGPTPPAQA